MSTIHGIQVYKIHENGSLLNAIYTDTSLANSNRYTIESEIARKCQYTETGVLGFYECKNLEFENSIVRTYTLEIRKHDEVYEFTWKEENAVRYTGIGLKVGYDHIAVSYVKVEDQAIL